jgi:glycine cleavage system transcriptional repressor
MQRLSTNALRLSRSLRSKPMSDYANVHFSTRKDQSFLVVNAVGLDRPGIVSDMTKVVTDANGSVGESRALKLGDHFTLMMLCSVPGSNEEKFRQVLDRVKDLHVTTFKTRDPETLELSQKVGYEGHFKLSGADHPGIAYKVTSLMAKHGLNISNLKTSDEDAPYGGTRLFQMEGIVTVPEGLSAGFNIDAIRDELVDLGDSLNCDVSLEDFTAEEEFGYSMF